MEKEIFLSEKKKPRRRSGLLPNYFKLIGLGVIILAIVPALVVNTMGLALSQIQKETFLQLTMNGFIFGLFFVAWAKDKFEDEMSLLLRLRAMGFAFLCAIFFVILDPVFNLVLRDRIREIKSQELVTTMLFVYIIYFWLQKKFS